MSFDFPAQPQRQVRPRGGGCGRLIFMMAIMFAVYYMFSAGRARQQKPDRGPGDILAPGPRQNGREDLKQEIFGDGAVGSGKAGSNDREDLKQDIFGNGTVGSRHDRQPQGRQMPSTGRSGADRGWQMDDVESSTKSDNDFRNDSRLPAPTNSQPRSKNDWSISDADDLKAEAVPAGREQTPLKKAESGWKLEEVD